ncbi:MAG: pyridoxal-phosphate dependent enzyme [Gammaproteobacteria bacterium]|nr:pyridoxal-phosphate dependent enzyme [Gammaproteobacteria bacterium]MDE2344830.1 pyridoxal-phosphate dependent enzyme [Gammaproteobacteria bacterium]
MNSEAQQEHPQDNCLRFSDIRAAAANIAAHIRLTPVLRCPQLDDRLDAEIFFKCENFQEMGAFKLRGATNAVFTLPETAAAKGVATHSSGNHGAAVALAARRRGITACVVMPENASSFKKRAVTEYGAKVIFCESSMRGRETALAEYVSATGAAVVHPYNDIKVMAGQGTAALELHAQVEQLDLILAPVGGGGLLSGTAVATRALRPGCSIIGVEPAGADDARRSLELGRITALAQPETIADGLRATVGPLPFAVLRSQVDDIVCVSDESIIRAMRYIWERMKIIIEPSSAVVAAAMLDLLVDVKGKRVGVILSGGNVDLDQLPW